ncbi:glycosyltransferase family 90 protein [Collybiopsis luxurians FD-317 M1]|nr:glycosyltransferase family 90 protein [Collybiopsis luxurians FD-317 M1]
MATAHRRTPSATPWTVHNIQNSVQHRLGLQQRRWRPLFMWMVLGCFLVGIFRVGLKSGSPGLSLTSIASTNPSGHPSTLTYATHPITLLMSAAEERFRAKLARQSKTLPDAIAEYKRRYGMPPPKGFDQWWDYVKKYDVIMTDEFDLLMRDLAPFYALRGKRGEDYQPSDEDSRYPGSGVDEHGWALGGGAEMRRRIAEVAGVSSIDLVRIRDGVPSTVSINKDGFVDDEVSARARGLKSMLGKTLHDVGARAKKEGKWMIPDLDFPVNAKAEGRVIVGWERWDDRKTGTGAGAGSGSEAKGQEGPVVLGALGNGNRSYVSDVMDPSLSAADPEFNASHPLATFKPDWRGEGNVWDAWRRTCPPNSTARKMFSSIRNMDLSLEGKSKRGIGSRKEDGPPPSFSYTPTNAFHSASFCDEPHLHYTQGHFFSDWRTIGELYPVLSPARAKGFGDIKIPSHYYYGSTDRYTYGWDEVNLELEEVDRGEVAWGAETDGILGGPEDTEGGVDDRDLIIDPAFDGHTNTVNPPKNRKTHRVSKRNKIFWRGATTGGGNEPPGFSPFYQRHRAVRMAGWDADGEIDLWVPVARGNYSSSQTSTNAEAETVTPTPDIPLTHLRIPLSTLNQAIMDVAFVKATNPDQYPGGLEKLMEEHRFSGGVYLGGHWQYKYLLDLDGMSYSGRFMSFLASDSVPVKSTVYEEFFGDWIEPWLHYIPLSASYEEIYNIFAYFSGVPAEVVEAVYANSSSSAHSSLLSVFPEGAKLSAIPGAPDGDARLRRIARAGKQWKKTIGRTLDLESYVYRLALEWARLCADDREAMSMRV